MPTTSRKGSTPDEPTAARALELLEAPVRARRAAEEAADAANKVRAQQTLAAAMSEQLTVLTEVADDVDRWFTARPPVEQAQFEETLGPRHREAIDRVVLVGVSLQERAGGPVQQECRRGLAALAAPLPPDELGRLIKLVASLEEGEASLKAAHASWLTICQEAAAPLLAAVVVAQGQIAWLQGAKHA